jgi:uncharacterized membrane protein
VVTGAPRPHVHGIDVARVEAAIQAAERGTSGELRVAISRFYFWGDVRRAAEIAFRRLHMDHTRHRNGVLIFVAPRLRRFAIVGDVGIHRHVTATFWNDLADDVSQDFRAGDLTAGLERAIARIGERFALHFPPDPGAGNELPNQVVL